MLGEAVACGAFLKYKQTDVLEAYIRGPPLYIQGSSGHKRAREKKSFIPT
jgi:hypothetical protein